MIEIAFLFKFDVKSNLLFPYLTNDFFYDKMYLLKNFIKGRK